MVSFTTKSVYNGTGPPAATALYCPRRFTRLVTSTADVSVTGAAVRKLSTIRAAIALRTGVSGTIRPRDGTVLGACAATSRSRTRAPTSTPTPSGANASSAISTRPVLATDQPIVSTSSGATVRGSMSLTETPSRSNSAQASSASRAMRARATTVTSAPSRATAARPSGISYAASGTGSLRASSSRCSRKTTGSLHRRAWCISPFASYGVDGTTTRRPGNWANSG